MSQTLSEIYPSNPKTSGASVEHPSTSKITEDMTAELETENLPLTDSQLERVREQIPNTIPINPPRARQSTTTATGSTTYMVNVIDSKTRQPQYHFHGCTVNIFNK